MTTKDPHLVKTPINNDAAANEGSVTAASLNTSDNLKTSTGEGDDDKHILTADRQPDADSNDLESETTTQKGTETLEADHGDTKHVKEGDNPARQPDSRDQSGQYFDKGVNQNAASADSSIDEQPQSDEINDLNRYDTLDNAQTRVLNTNDKKPAQ